MNTLLKYNRKAKEYQLIDTTTGEIIATAPHGKTNKAKLEVTQLQFEANLAGINPGWLMSTIRRQTARYPQITGRIFRAALILATDGVQLDGGPGRYHVQSQSGNGTYTVTNNGRRTCQCQDYENGLVGHQYGAPMLDGAPCCKHLLAADLHHELHSHQRDTALPVQPPANRSRMYKS